MLMFLFHDSGFSTTDETSSQITNVSKPSAKSIYCKLLLWKKSHKLLIHNKNQTLTALLCGLTVQRLQYAASMNKMLEKFQYKVEVWRLRGAPLNHGEFTMVFVLCRSTCSPAIWTATSWEMSTTVWSVWSCWIIWVACGVRTWCWRCTVPSCGSQTSKQRYQALSLSKDLSHSHLINLY